MGWWGGGRYCYLKSPNLIRVYPGNLEFGDPNIRGEV